MQDATPMGMPPGSPSLGGSNIGIPLGAPSGGNIRGLILQKEKELHDINEYRIATLEALLKDKEKEVRARRLGHAAVCNPERLRCTCRRTRASRGRRS